MNLGQMLFNGKCKVFAPFYYIPMEIGIKYFLQGNFSIKIINIMKKYLLLFSLTIFLFACNKDEEISQDVILPPVIELDSDLSECRLRRLFMEMQRLYHFRRASIEIHFQRMRFVLRYPACGYEGCQHRGRNSCGCQ